MFPFFHYFGIHLDWSRSSESRALNTLHFEKCGAELGRNIQMAKKLLQHKDSVAPCF